MQNKVWKWVWKCFVEMSMEIGVEMGVEMGVDLCEESFGNMNCGNGRGNDVWK